MPAMIYSILAHFSIKPSFDFSAPPRLDQQSYNLLYGTTSKTFQQNDLRLQHAK